MKGQTQRIVIGMFMPAIIGSLLMFFYLLGTESVGKPGAFDIWSAFIIIVFALLFSGIQSTLYSLVMEFIVNRYFKRDDVVVGLSILLGLFSVLILHPIEPKLFSPSKGLPVLIFIGPITGLIVGVLLRRMYLHSLSVESMQSISLESENENREVRK